MSDNIIKNHEERERAKAIQKALEKTMDKNRPTENIVIEDEVEKDTLDENIEALKDINNMAKEMIEIPEAKPMKGLIYLPPEIQNLKKKDKCAIIGFAPSWYQAPWRDETFDIWGINELYKFSGREAEIHKVKPRYDIWFEIHDILNSPSKQKKEHQEFLKNCPYPLVTQKHFEEFPKSIAYPREEIKAFINKGFVLDDENGSPFTDYSNQISWMTALAICMGYREIHIYGVDMAANSEYNFQRASCQFFIGLAVGIGIKVLIPKSSELCKHYCDYGFESDNSGRFRVKDRIKNLNEDLKAMEQRLAEIEFFKNKLDKDLDIQKTLINNTISELKQERAKSIAMIESNKGLLKFLSSAPEDLKTYLKKREGVLKQVESVSKQNEEVLKNIAAELGNQIAKRDEEEKRVFMNKKILDDEATMIRMTIAGRQGIISENKHLLNNNLI